jgi:hypothetical protein
MSPLCKLLITIKSINSYKLCDARACDASKPVKTVASVLSRNPQSDSANMPSELSLDVKARISVEARLRRCAVPGTSPELYGVVKAFQVFKKLKYTDALSRWKLVRKHVDVEDIVIPGPTGSLCVREEGLEKLLMSMKECEAKMAALTCKTCKRTETQNTIKRRIAELEELKTDALKRKAQAHQDLEEYASTQKRLRSQLLHLIV